MGSVATAAIRGNDADVGCGHTKPQKFDIWLGPAGGNGKGALSKIHKIAMGDYTVSLMSSVMQHAMPGQSKPNPAFLTLIGKQYLIVDEVDAEDKAKFNSCVVKSMTGNVELCARDLYSKKLAQILPSILADHGTQRGAYVSKYWNACWGDQVHWLS